MQELALSVVGLVENGSSGGVCRVGGAGGKGMLEKLCATDQPFPEIG